MEEPEENTDADTATAAATVAIKPRRLKSSDKLPPESHREYLDMDTDEEEFGHQETPEPQEESPPEPDKPTYTDDELDKLLEKVKQLTVLVKLSEKSWSKDCCDVIREYFREPGYPVLSLMMIGRTLHAQLDFPIAPGKFDGIAWFMRTEYWQIFKPEDFTLTVRFGSFSGCPTVNYLYRCISCLYAPVAFRLDSHWPRVMKNEIFSNLNDLIISAIDNTYKPTGLLILYVPWERIDVEPDNKEEQEAQVNRLEKIAYTWVKKIREELEVLRIKIHEIHDLVREFEFWKGRFDNLTVILRQLNKKNLRAIVDRLRVARSISVESLMRLHGRVIADIDLAKSNLAYLNIIRKNCETYSDLKDFQSCITKTLYILFVISSDSPYYSIEENLERILGAFSLHVVQVCSKNFDSKLIFEDPKECKKSVETNLACCKYYSNTYDSIINSCYADNEWRIDKKVVFNCVNNFEQRCRDLVEICDAVLIYGGLNKFHFGGTKGNKYDMRYLQVSNYFSEIMKQMRVNCTYALDITRTKWYEDIFKFRKNIAELESTISNIFNELFEDVNNLNLGIESLYTLLKFKDRRGFCLALNKKWIQIWKIFNSEVRKCLSRESPGYEIVQDRIKLLPVDSLMVTHNNKKYLARLQKAMQNASDWLEDCDDIQFEMPPALMELLKMKI